VSRFYVPKEAVTGELITVSGKEAHHILDVMRLKVSDEAVVFDGTGTEYSCVVKEAARKSLVLQVMSRKTRAHCDGCDITLIQAIPKKEKMDYIVEKATELGIARIMPVTTARTIPEWSAAKKEAAADRWRKIALAASKQCGRADVPEIFSIKDIKTTIDRISTPGVEMRSWPGRESVPATAGKRLIATLDDKAVKLKDVLKNAHAKGVVIAIGPEGDFTPEEVAMCERAGFRTVSLGERVLKSDTAGLAALAIINYEYEK
jgi:16S rRNA (uracil1498-N3)-methyltransferase